MNQQGNGSADRAGQQNNTHLFKDFSHLVSSLGVFVGVFVKCSGIFFVYKTTVSGVDVLFCSATESDSDLEKYSGKTLVSFWDWKLYQGHIGVKLQFCVNIVSYDNKNLSNLKSFSSEQRLFLLYSNRQIIWNSFPKEKTKTFAFLKCSDLQMIRC